MNIVHIITRLILGGAQENTLLTCEGLRRRGHEVTLITGPALGPEGQLRDRAQAGGYRVIEIDAMRRAINPVHDVPCYKQLKKILAELDADIVHTHSAKAGILGRRAAAALRDKNIKACCPRVRTFQAAQAACSARPRIVHSVHGLSFHPYQSGMLNRIYISIERRAAQYTDAFISVAHAMTRQSLAAGIGQERQYTRIFSGLETGHFLPELPGEQWQRLREANGIPEDAVVMATVARLFHLKGHEYIIAAAKKLASRHPKAIWLFIGDGILRESLTREIETAGLRDRFRFTGLVPPEEVGQLLHASDILVHCSLREGLARAIPQAMLCGKPVAAFDLDGTPEVVRNGETGLLVPAKDVDALTAAQEKLIEDPELRRRLGETGRAFCRKEFDHELMVERIEAVYKNIAVGS